MEWNRTEVQAIDAHHRHGWLKQWLWKQCSSMDGRSDLISCTIPTMGQAQADSHVK